MKTLTLKNKHRTQRGFFDFGLGLTLLAIFGGAAVTVDSDKTDENSYVEQRVISAPSEVPSEIVVVQTGSE